MIQNPIIKGFHPDPSIIRVGEDYYIATSTFEWWPGVEIWHSRDLKNWHFHSRPLNRKSQLDLEGVPDGGGVYAPCLSYDGKVFYLVYTNVRQRGAIMQTDNYLVTTEDINSEWSDGIYLNSLGFDPSMFHDEDGRKYLLSLDNHYEKGKRFNGLWLQEYNPAEKKLTGELKQIYKVDELVEGSHIYRHNGYYYLLKAQGGTGERHSCQLSRSKNLWGGYEDCPEILLHSRDNPELFLQQGGHGDIVDTPNGELYLVHLARRKDAPCCGRETCIQKIQWTNEGWLRLSQGGENPHVLVEEAGLKEDKPWKEEVRSDFTKLTKMPDCFMSLRGEVKDAVLDENGLTMVGKDGPTCKFNQSLYARRITDRDFTVETKVIFSPDSEKQLAGIMLMYDTSHWIYFYITKGNGGNEARTLICDNGGLIYSDCAVKVGEEAILRCEAVDNRLRFFADTERSGEEIDLTILSDDHVFLGFTGAMAGIACYDLYRKEKKAVFEYFEYCVK